MPQIRVVPLHTIRLALSRRDCMLAVRVQQGPVRFVAVAEVALWLQLGRLVHQGLKRVDVARQAHGPGQNAASVSVYCCADVNKVFLCVRNVYSSSISTVWAWAGVERVGRASQAALTQLTMVCGATPTSRAVRLRLMPSTYIRRAARRTSGE